MAHEAKYYGRATQTGLTLTAQLYNSSAAASGSAISMTETAVGSSAIYTGTVPASTVAGTYWMRILDGSTVLGQGEFVWDGAAEVTLYDSSTARKLLQNDRTTNPSGGAITVLDDDGSGFMTGSAHNDAAGSVTYDGTDGINHTSRLS